MKKCIIVIILLLSLSLVSAYDLSEYPEMFLVKVSDKTYLNAQIVVGNNAASSDVIGAIDIATSLNYHTKSSDSKENSIEAVLASEIRGQELNKNLILVGGPCINSATAVIMGYPKDCADGFYKGKAIIKLYENNGFNALVIAGMTAEDTKLAAKVLADNLYDFKGKEIEVAGTSIKDIKIKSVQ